MPLATALTIRRRPPRSDRSLRRNVAEIAACYLVVPRLFGRGPIHTLRSRAACGNRLLTQASCLRYSRKQHSSASDVAAC
jgi:hypothetical protein